MSEKRKLFGTDGVRGKANVHPMTAEVALALGQAIATVLRVPGGERRRIIIGKDTRLSGYLFEDALAAGICSMGVDVIQVGPMPTPGMAFLAHDMRCHAGVMISASHNPYHDNGIKFFSSDGYKLPDTVEEKIEALISSGKLAELRAGADDIGRATRIEDAEGRYVVFLKNTFPSEFSLDGLRVVLDCANGAAYKVGPTVLRELGAEVFPLGVEPDGRNINDGCGAMHPERTAAKVREVRAGRRDRPRWRCRSLRDRGRGRPGPGRRRAGRDLCPGPERTRRAQGRSGGRHGHEQSRPGEGAREDGRGADPHPGGRPLRRRADARRGLQPGRRAVGSHRAAGSQHHRGWPDDRAPDAGHHAPPRHPALRAGAGLPALSPGSRQRGRG
jgi:hypothetical protein